MGKSIAHQDDVLDIIQRHLKNLGMGKSVWNILEGDMFVGQILD